MNIENYINKHEFWDGQFFKATRDGTLSYKNYQALFSQYYFYSKNFVKLIAAGMLKIDNDYHRAQLIDNLWEESGEKDIDTRHSKLFSTFLIETMGISNPEATEISSETQCFINSMLNYCLSHSPVEVIAFLAYGVEGIVPRLYQYFIDGLNQVGVPKNELTFFTLHVACDDEHAETLRNICQGYATDSNFHQQVKNGIDAALSLRGQFLNLLYYKIKLAELEKNIHSLLHKKNRVPEGYYSKLYERKDEDSTTHFSVKRYHAHSSVLDPRMLSVPPYSSTELHAHAHETMFYIIEGLASITIDDKTRNYTIGDLIYVPRWHKHQTKNLTANPLTILAITDYHFTHRFTQQRDIDYRQKSVPDHSR